MNNSLTLIRLSDPEAPWYARGNDETFGEWLRRVRKRRFPNETLVEVYGRIGKNHSFGSRLENDMPRRIDGSLPEPKRDTVLILADLLCLDAQIVLAAAYPAPPAVVYMSGNEVSVIPEETTTTRPATRQEVEAIINWLANSPPIIKERLRAALNADNKP